MIRANEMHARNAKEAIARGHSIPSDIVFRPIQYLGSKLRSINYIVPNLTRYIAPRSTVFDVFTGTSVVAQALADANMRVVATDVMGFCATFAESLLSIGRAESRIQSPSALFSLLNDYANEGAVSPTYSDLIAEEQSAINSANSEALLSIANRVPAGWKSTSRSSNSPLSWNLSQSISLPELSLKGIIANYYAGTYFGVRQAIAIDKLRISIEIARDANSLSRWEYVTALTALLYACSSAVFSPGKHFAQYHKTDGGKNLTFHKKRILSDRAVDIEHQFLAAMKAIFDRPHDRSISHIVKQLSMEETFADSSWLPKVDLVYADPPYTAQQYSRFYHIPETLINYREPKMQEFRGDYTVGMYPAERFKSRFSSKRQAPGAFDDLIKLSTRLGASLAISYSESASGQTGNDRMIRLDDLAQMCRRGFGTVHIEKLSHAYRQFNDSSAAVEERADHEYLVVCNP